VADGDARYEARFINRNRGPSRSAHYKHDKCRTLYKADRVSHHRRRNHNRNLFQGGLVSDARYRAEALGVERMHGPSSTARKKRKPWHTPRNFGARSIVRGIGRTRDIPGGIYLHARGYDPSEISPSRWHGMRNKGATGRERATAKRIRDGEIVLTADQRRIALYYCR
jgi:nucleotidyltransferase/DNA polymerase involved in DNA repair